MRKSRTPAGFVPKPLRNCSLKNPETFLLEPTKNKEIMPKPCETARQTFAQRKTWKPASHQAKLKKKVFGTRVRKSRTPAGFVPKPLRNCSRKNPETLLLEPIKNKEIVPKPCETAARKMSKRCFWNPLKTKKKVRNPPLESLRHRLEIRPLVRQTGTRMRKSRTPAGFVPKPLRNCSLKNPLEPIKNKEIVPKPCETARQTFAQRKT